MDVHPLEDEWVLWEHRTGSDESSYSNNLARIGEFSTVEGFFSYVTNMPWPSQFFYTKPDQRLKLGGRDVVGFSCFKKGIQPCWEDPKNISGGEWRIRKFSSLEEVDQAWKGCAFLAIGNNFDPSINITGCRVVDSSHPEKNRPMYNVEIWFENNDHHRDVETLICDTMKVDTSKMFFRSHCSDNGHKEKPQERSIAKKGQRNERRSRKTHR